MSPKIILCLQKALIPEAIEATTIVNNHEALRKRCSEHMLHVTSKVGHALFRYTIGGDHEKGKGSGISRKPGCAYAMNQNRGNMSNKSLNVELRYIFYIV